MKITASVTKSLYQDHGPPYLHLIIFLFSSLLRQIKKVVAIAVFLSKLDHRKLFSYIYYETFLAWGFISI